MQDEARFVKAALPNLWHLVTCFSCLCLRPRCPLRLLQAQFDAQICVFALVLFSLRLWTQGCLCSPAWSCNLSSAVSCFLGALNLHKVLPADVWPKGFTRCIYYAHAALLFRCTVSCFLGHWIFIRYFQQMSGPQALLHVVTRACCPSLLLATARKYSTVVAKLPLRLLRQDVAMRDVSGAQ